MDLDKALADIAENPPIATGKHKARALGALAIGLIATDDENPAMRRAARQLLTGEPVPPTVRESPATASPRGAHLASLGAVPNSTYRRST